VSFSFAQVVFESNQGELIKMDTFAIILFLVFLTGIWVLSFAIQERKK
jgi:hypothetical protein